MKIAVTYKSGDIFQHFGHTEELKIYDVQNSLIVSSEVIKAVDGGHSALVGLLKKNNIEILICGGIGGGAQTALSENNIQLFGGVSGNADIAVQKYLSGELEYNKSPKCNHFEDHHAGEEHHHCHGANECSHKN